MRNLVLAFAFVSISLYADLFVKITASGGAPIPVAYDSANSQSAALTTSATKHIAIQNKTAGDIAYSRGEAGTAPSKDEGICQAGAACVKDGFNMSNRGVLYIRSDTGGTITAEDVVIEIW